MRKPEIHNKVWGIEKWIVNTDKYCGKILVIDRARRSSIHYHEKKDETFYLLKGIVLLEINDGEEEVMREDYIGEIHPETRHRFTGLEDSLIVEFSTHHEEIDSYRETESEKLSDEEFRSLLERLKAQSKINESEFRRLSGDLNLTNKK